MTAPHEPNGRRANDNAPEVTSGEAPAGGDQRARFKEPTPPAPPIIKIDFPLSFSALNCILSNNNSKAVV